MPRARSLHFARRCDLPEAHGDDNGSVGQCRVAKAASRCVDARGRPAAGRLSKDRQDAVTAREKLERSMARSWGTFLALALCSYVTTFAPTRQITRLCPHDVLRCFLAPHDVLQCFLPHTMYFTVFLLHTMYFGDFSGRWLRPLGTCKVLIPGDMRRALASQPSVAPPQAPAPCSSRAAP